MNNDTLQNSWEDALTPSQPVQVKRSWRTSSPFPIIAEADESKRRGTEPIAMVLARVYRILLAGTEAGHEKILN